MDDIPHNFAHDGSRHVYNMPQIEMSPEYFQVLQDVNGGTIAEDVYGTHRPSVMTQESFARFEDASFEDSRSPSQRWSRVSIDSDSDSENLIGRPESLRGLSGSSFIPGSASDTPFGSSTIRPAPTSNGPAPLSEHTPSDAEENGEVNAPKPSSGYYNTFFREETRLGMGANGSVYLCQHVLNGIPLGHFAVKKIAVGDSPAYLMEILREVRLHAKLHHRNIITYHHAWLESARFSSFGLAIPTLHVLMQWAELGSLDDLILQRLGVKTADRDPNPSEPPSGEYQTREERIRAFRARAGGGPAHSSGEVRRREARRRAREMKAVHLLSAEEIRSLFGDVVAGLAFLTTSNVCEVMALSDFGTAQDALQSTRERSGNTGTLEYSAPESLRHNQDGSLRQITSKSDVWSLGMILHKLIYFRLPWKNDEDMAELEKEIIGFQGYKANAENIQGFEKRRLPAALCQLLSRMLAVEPSGRPGSDQVLKAIHSRQLDPSPDLGEASLHQGIGPLVRRPTPPSRGNESLAVSSDTGIDDSDAFGQGSSADVPTIDSRGRAASSTQARRRSDPVGEISGIAPRLLVLEGPAPAARRVAGLLSSINVSRVLSRGFKGALLICKASTF
ncbi:putative serine/threonine-protein kinase iks1 [Ceratobasidium sp. 423]|nr:putative serine/threonine-protein kinase iks1 [Ceratobasidium sp. 423]